MNVNREHLTSKQQMYVLVYTHDGYVAQLPPPPKQVKSKNWAFLVSQLMILAWKLM